MISTPAPGSIRRAPLVAFPGIGLETPLWSLWSHHTGAMQAGEPKYYWIIFITEESSLLNSHLSWEQSRRCLPLSGLFWPGKGLLQSIILQAGNQSGVNLPVVNAADGLKEIQKSASAGEQSQVTTSAREKKTNTVVGLQTPPLAFFPEEKQNCVPHSLLLKCN